MDDGVRNRKCFAFFWNSCENIAHPTSGGFVERTFGNINLQILRELFDIGFRPNFVRSTSDAITAIVVVVVVVVVVIIIIATTTAATIRTANVDVDDDVFPVHFFFHDLVHKPRQSFASRVVFFKLIFSVRLILSPLVVVVFVVYFANDFLDAIFETHEPDGPAVFVYDDGDVILSL